ncbi:MAG: hypothetical protein N3F09_08880 [Bacteroidia bacterium]|nr:hypothetical protein [Bacteroidia bacterium]
MLLIRILKKQKYLSKTTLFRPVLILWLCFLPPSLGQSREPCPCPAVPFDAMVPSKYEIIFCGKVMQLKKLNENLNTVVFEVKELYKGNVTQNWEVHFNPDDPCAVSFNPGEEWLMFLNYYQNNNSKLNWCSHSRKYYRAKTDDPYWISSGWEYDDVKSFLKKNLGTYRVLQNVGSEAKNRNLVPNRWEFFIYLLASAGGMFLIYYFTKKYL